MVKGALPGEFEQIVLLAMASLGREASGREVYQVVRSMTGREVSVAAVHITLARLHDKGWAKCRTMGPEPGRGGKPRRRYAMSRKGAAVLKEQRAQLERLWGEAATHPLLGGD